MNFMDIARARQSCRSFDASRPVDEAQLRAVLEAARLAPSACNGQPYRLTVCRGERARAVARTTMSRGMNAFADKAPVMIVFSEEPYVKSAALGARITHNDYRSMDIGIVCAYLTAEAAAQGLATCILGWFDDEAVRSLCGLDHPVRLIVALGHAQEGDPLREKKRKSMEELAVFLD